ncbi:hypothetical protein ACQUZQ_00455 [Aeromonas veronii]|uniref:hypothetical protein n=2 Tax=Aeromonas TaxID=642 RepID=UPI003D254F01
MEIKRWEEYQKFFQLIVLRYLVVWFSIVPIIAGLVSQLPDPLPVNILGNTYNIELTLPFHWQLLWISSLLFVISLGLYKFFCPSFIHKYNNFSEYSLYKHHPRWLAWEAHRLLRIANKKQKIKLIKRLETKGYIDRIEQNIDCDLIKDPEVKEEQTIIKFKVDNVSYQFGMPINGRNNDETEKDIFYELFGRYSESWVSIRLIIMILLFLSLCSFIIVLLQHIYSGGLFAYNWLLGFIN